MVAATPFGRALPVLVTTCTDNKSHWLTGTLKPLPTPQQPGPAIAVTPVDCTVEAQSVLLNTVAVTVSPAIKLKLRIFNTRPVMVAFCGTTTLLLANPPAPPWDVPRPRKSLLPTCWSVPK